jgi:dienelactone hydrolase
MDLVTRDVEYWHDGTRMLGRVCAPTGGRRSLGVLLIHDAFGISDEMTAHARRLAEAGHPVFLADVWGERYLPRAQAEIGQLIGGMVDDRDRWMGRVGAAHTALADQPEFDDAGVVLLGYCFGGSSVLEYVRTGAKVAGAISIHGGLDLLAPDWSSARPTSVLVCTGVEDPMATAEMRDRLTEAMDDAGMDWQVHLYSGTKHAFTSPMAQHSPMPDVIAYQPRSAARAWRATVDFLGELADLEPLN